MNPHRIYLLLCFFCVLILLFSSIAPPHAFAWVSPTTHGPSPGVVHQAYNPPQHNWLSGHRGVDLAATPGSPIYAAGDGTVAFIGVVAGSPTVSIDHEEPLPAAATASDAPAVGQEITIRTTYQPVIPHVEKGQRVREGEMIGHMGGQPAPRHQVTSGLHWGARILPTDDRYINPLILLPTPTIRLKPLSPDRSA
ncbi:MULTISPECIES: M23 family metallopeptidase [unclassified Corynebacterium]|uniref:M23 family metallopeptidase n=1 Tax=unclassified Corynebacterium TaxID=2624378 RepID=UPI0029C9EA18|nr:MULTISPECIES: M23 family metallopeptidase [unclassified Corynebacterium]WPF65330.1 M23 family metallopeptidase [Corynebacterium sp. 22KM0430]WPF67825.1 M23 family metallopeptidase [Corynebacterium sp. 21KM1197]